MPPPVPLKAQWQNIIKMQSKHFSNRLRHLIVGDLFHAILRPAVSAGAKQVQAPRVSSEAVGNECHPAVMDLSAHAPSPILVPSAEQEVPLKAAHHTPRGRPSKTGKWPHLMK